MSSPSNNFLLRNNLSLCVQDCLHEEFYCRTPQTLLTLSAMIKSSASLCRHTITVMPPAAIDFFVAGFSENAKYLEARNLVRGDPGESCWHRWQSDEWNDWEGERCQTEASLSWKKPPVVLRAIKLYCARTWTITKPVSPTWPLLKSQTSLHVYFSQYWKGDHLFLSTLEKFSQYSVYLLNISGQLWSPFDLRILW